MQTVIVSLLVIAASLVSIWKLLPARRRLRLLVALDGYLARRHRLPAWRQRVLARKIQTSAGSGCAGCAASVGLRPPHPRR